MRQGWPGSTFFRADCPSGVFPFVTEADRTVSRYDSKSRIADLSN